MLPPIDVIYCKDRLEWRRWLEKNHAASKEVWLGYYKGHTGRESVSYDESVEEAICFGWIDGVIKRVDDLSFAHRFSPRRLGSKWSALNLDRLRKMLELGRMTEAGTEHAPSDFQAPSTPNRVSSGEPALPEELASTLRRNDVAWKNFRKLAPSYKKLYVRWILDAKRPETRRRRLEEAIGKLERGEKLGMK